MNGPILKRFRAPWEKAATFALLLAYAVLLSFVIPRHAPWADEAQAWQIARSVGFLQLVRTTIHYEVTPALWHVLLWPLARLHMTYAELHWMCGLIALGGVCLVVLASPFPLAIRLALPFTYFFAFQYAVVARSYVLFAPLLFLLAIAWPRRDRRPIVAAMLIGLLANTSAHGMMAAIGLAIVLFTEWLPRTRIDPQQTRRWMWAGAIMIILIALAGWCLVPPRDAAWLVVHNSARHLGLNAVAIGMKTSQPWLEALPPALQIPLKLVLKFGTVLCYGISYPKTLAGAAWLLLLWRWRREQQMRYTIPVLLLALFCMLGRFDTYHAGLVWMLLLFVWWVTWPANPTDPRQRALVVIIVCCMAIQIGWAMRVIRYDVSEQYSPDREAAPILARYLARGDAVDVAAPDRTLHAGHSEFFEVGLEPYFATEPFHNMATRYWIWGTDQTMRARYVVDTERRSVDVLLDEIGNDGAVTAEQKRLIGLGYEARERVCGQVMYPVQYYSPVCHEFYVPNFKR